MNYRRNAIIKLYPDTIITTGMLTYYNSAADFDANKDGIAEPLYADNMSEYSGRQVSSGVWAHAPQANLGLLVGKVIQRQCRALIMNGQRQCNNHTIALPYCTRHSSLLLQLRIKTSTIAGAGLGVFADGGGHANNRTEVFKPGDIIGEYQGEVLTEAQYKRRYHAFTGNSQKKDTDWFTPYAVSAGGKWIIDGIVVRGIIGYANDTRGSNNSYNAELLEHSCKTVELHKDVPVQLVMTATRTIYHNDEIFWDYGRPYWKSFYNCQQRA